MTDKLRQAAEETVKNKDWEAVAADQGMTISILKQREWVGLTDHDIHQLRQQGAHSVSDKEFRMIEAKLKEKNT